jgi:long-chain acyl-CoA synthetase
VLAEHLGRRDPDERAVSPDGVSWVSVGELLARARSVAAVDDVLPITTADAVEAVVALVGAQLGGATPMVLPTGAAPVPPAVVRDEPLLALATSGTTSAPRVVVRTAASWDAALEPFTVVTGQRPDDVAWAPGLPSSTLTLWALQHALATGTPVVASGRWRGVPDRLDAVTVLHTVPAVLADVLAARAGGALPRLRLAVVAGAAVPPALREHARALGIRIVEYYGAAELSFVAVDRGDARLRAFPGAELRVRDGLIEVRSPYVARGYARGSGPLTLTGGWATVGDRGRLGADGVLVVAGRADDALSVGGTTVLVADVERVLGGIEGVLEVACLAEPDARLGQRPVAVLRVAAGVDDAALTRRLRTIARQDLPPAARPVRYLIVNALPRTMTGKIDRNAPVPPAARDA